MQPITIAENPGRAHDIAAELMAFSVLGVKGKVEVELVDDRNGRVLRREEAPNYVNTTQWTRFAKAIQKAAWTYGYQGGISTVTARTTDGRDPRYIPTLRNDHLACWTDTTAETTADLYPLGEIIAWAHRFQQGSPSTRQGIVQPTLCTLTDTAVSWVWEWATANGNGTFQSVGWRRLGYSSNSGDTTVYDMPHFSRRMSAAYTDAISGATSPNTNWTAGTATSALFAPYYDASSGKLYMNVNPSATSKLVSNLVTIDANGNYSLGATTDESAAAFAAGVGGDNIALATRSIQGITRLGAAGDWIAVGYTGVTTARRPTLRRTTNAGSVTYTNANAGTYSVESGFIDVTYDGTDLWVVAMNGNTGVPAIHRVAASTGTISATLTVAGLPAYFPSLTGSARNFSGIEWDADNSWLWICTSDGFLFNLDTSGNWGGVLLTNNTNTSPITAATLSGQHNGNRMNSLGVLDVDPTYVQFAPAATTDAIDVTWPGSQNTLPNTVPANLQAPGTQGRLLTMDGDVWLGPGQGFYNAQTRGSLNAFTELHNFATRSLLSGSVTKNNTQTMRIRYTMTFT